MFFGIFFFMSSCPLKNGSSQMSAGVWTTVRNLFVINKSCHCDTLLSSRDECKSWSLKLCTDTFTRLQMMLIPLISRNFRLECRDDRCKHCGYRAWFDPGLFAGKQWTFQLSKYVNCQSLDRIEEKPSTTLSGGKLIEVRQNGLLLWRSGHRFLRFLIILVFSPLIVHPVL